MPGCHLGLVCAALGLWHPLSRAGPAQPVPRQLQSYRCCVGTLSNAAYLKPLDPTGSSFIVVLQCSKHRADEGSTQRGTRWSSVICYQVLQSWLWCLLPAMESPSLSCHQGTLPPCNSAAAAFLSLQVSSTSGSQTGGSITLSCVMADRWRAAKAKPEAGPIEGDCRDMCQGRGGDAELHLACACKGLPMTPTTKTW